MVYGTINGNLASAESDDPPTPVPPIIAGTGELIAKFIIKQTGEITNIEIVHAIISHGAGVPNHDDTGGIDTGNIQHLTSAQKTDLTDEENSTLHQFCIFSESRKPERPGQGKF